MTGRYKNKDWSRVKFGDVVQLNRDRIADPLAEGVERYVGLEHIEPEDLRVRSWGLVEEGITFTNAFRPGQVLFGKRRAYQRKVAVADFSGVCSSDIYVLESADPAVLLPDLLPFICQTEGFFEHAVGTSAGSLSPRTNWTQLANYEFALPPLAEQRRIAEVLWAYNLVLNGLDDSIQAGQALYQSVTDAHAHGEHQIRKVQSWVGMIPTDWSLVQLEEVFSETQYGLSIAPNVKGAYPILRMMNIENRLVVENDLKFVDLTEKDFDSYRLLHGDILFNRTNSYELVGRTGIYKLEGDHVFASYLVRIRTVPDRLLPEYLVAYMNSSLGRRQILSYATRGVSQANINASNLSRVYIPLPPIDEQRAMIEEQESIQNSMKLLESRREQAYQTKRQMIEELLAQ